LLGTSYGGDGQNTFKLPDFSGRAGCQQGQGPGLTPRPLGATFGSNSVTLDSNQMPQHNHVINAFSQPDASKKGHSPGSGSAFSSLGSATAKPFVTAPLNTQFATNMIQASAGGGQPHPNQQPYLALNFCIALQGEFPSFS
jgi:microcystin-dependent protein